MMTEKHWIQKLMEEVNKYVKMCFFYEAFLGLCNYPSEILNKKYNNEYLKF